MTYPFKVRVFDLTYFSRSQRSKFEISLLVGMFCSTGKRMVPGPFHFDFNETAKGDPPSCQFAHLLQVPHNNCQVISLNSGKGSVVLPEGPHPPAPPEEPK